MARQDLHLCLATEVARFERMAEVRRAKAVALIGQGKGNAVIIALHAAADAYQRCADELARVLAGELPPPPGDRWPDP